MATPPRHSRLVLLAAVVGRVAGDCSSDLLGLSDPSDTVEYDRASASVCADPDCRALTLGFADSFPEVGACSAEQILDCVCDLVSGDFSASDLSRIVEDPSLPATDDGGALGLLGDAGSCSALFVGCAGSSSCASDLLTLCSADPITCLPTADTADEYDEAYTRICAL